MVQMAGVLVLAAGVPGGVRPRDYRAVTVGYLIMRIGLVAPVAAGGASSTPRAGDRAAYAAGISRRAGAAGCCASASPSRRAAAAALVRRSSVLVVLELAVPLVGGAHRGRPTGTRTTSPSGTGCSRSSCSARACWPRRPACRRRSSRRRVSGALVADRGSPASSSLFALWWLYFLDRPATGSAATADARTCGATATTASSRRSPALGAGLEVAVEQTGHHLEVSAIVVAYAVAGPGRRVFLVLLWAVHAPIVPRPVIRPVVILTAAAVVLLLPTTVGWAGTRRGRGRDRGVVAVVVAVTLVAPSGPPPAETSA